ncbi:MAG: TrmH family RNA methyltransferase [Candidatus Limimorpha sp.]
MTKNDIKEIQSLRLAKRRKEMGLFTAEGNKLVEELSETNFAIKDIFATEQWIAKNEAIADKIKGIEIIPSKQMEQISNFVTPPGIFAIAHTPSFNISPEDSNNELLLLLDGINDPGNLGTIIRTADWFGIKKVILSEDTCDPWQHKVIQSTMGSIFRTQIVETDIIQFLKGVSTTVFGALMQGKNIYKTDIKANQGVIIIGSESHGIRENVLPFISCPINIPRAEGSVTESLNASIAAGIIMAEVFRKSHKAQ